MLLEPLKHRMRLSLEVLDYFCQRGGADGLVQA